MSKLTITLSANAGISLTFGGATIWVDALHDEQVPGFSTVVPELRRKMEQSAAFSAPDVICFTHCHKDHYSRALTQQMIERWPDAQLILPKQEFAQQILLQGDDVRETICGVDFYFFRTVHEGPAYADVPHYGLLLSDGDRRILIAGDSALGETRLMQVVREAPADIAILNFPWITLRRGREFLQSYIRPRHLCVYHLPFAADDHNRYREATAKAASWLEIPDIRILDAPLQTENIP